MTDDLWFFALFPPPALAEAIARLRTPPRPEKLHITLFVPEHPVQALSLHRAGAAVSCAPFDVVLDRIECGFGASRCRILSPDAASAARLAALHAQVRDAALAAGATPLRETFRPHMTLARGAAEAPATPVPLFRWEARSLRLMRSLRQEGRYLLEGEWPLAAG